MKNYRAKVEKRIKELAERNPTILKIKNDEMLFLKEELKSRKQLNFAPYKHMILLKIRGASLEKVKQAAGDLFARLNKIKTGSIKMLSLHPGQRAKDR